MKYKISICHPEIEGIEVFPQLFNSKEAQVFFNSYPWKEQLKLLDNMDPKDVQYSPSVRFTNTTNNISLELTAEANDGKLLFSIWFERPIMTKILFGLLGEKNRMKLIDKSGFDHISSKKYLTAFLGENYDEIEKVMNQ